MKKILYVDMDNVLVDFASGVEMIPEHIQLEYKGRIDDVPGIFSLMKPVFGAISSFERLCKEYDTYILSTAPWSNSSAWSDKNLWVRKYLGEIAYKKLILTHHKNLNHGDFLIDDRTANGASLFGGQHIIFGSDEYPNWKAVCDYLL
tara:strand:+ start:4838 stop:5278 length:441 start_codon:yes stop_codon:yes gene_type:complete